LLDFHLTVGILILYWYQVQIGLLLQQFSFAVVVAASLYIVTEYAKYGNLKEYIRKNDESKAANPVHMLLYAYQIASGMDYLHAKKVGQQRPKKNLICQHSSRCVFQGSTQRSGSKKYSRC
jgi:serine/threonine protein kinase